MDLATRASLVTDLRRDEGVRPHAYTDTEGILTIGVGHNLITGPPLTDAAIMAILEGDLAATTAWLDTHLPWWTGLDAPRQRVLVNMAFNLGPRLLVFHQTLAAFEAHDYPQAAREMMSSVWARQVGARADRLSHLCATGQDLP